MKSISDFPLFGDLAIGFELPPLAHDVTATTVVLGAMASRDWRPMHHDRDFAINRNGVRDIFLNTPTQAAWFERYITDFTGPRGRIRRLKFAMKSSVFPGDRMEITGKVAALSEPDDGFGFADLELAVHVGERLATTCSARVAVPLAANDNPWRCGTDAWHP